MEFSKTVTDLVAQAEKELAVKFAEFDRTAFENTARVLDAFREHKVSDAMFAGTIPSEIRWDVTSAIVNGTPLPKGHGRKPRSLPHRATPHSRHVLTGTRTAR